MQWCWLLEVVMRKPSWLQMSFPFSCPLWWASHFFTFSGAILAPFFFIFQGGNALLETSFSGNGIHGCTHHVHTGRIHFRILKIWTTQILWGLESQTTWVFSRVTDDCYNACAKEMSHWETTISTTKQPPTAVKQNYIWIIQIDTNINTNKTKFQN